MRILHSFPYLSLLPDAVPTPDLKFLYTISELKPWAVRDVVGANHRAPDSLTVTPSKLPPSIMAHLGMLWWCW